MSDLWLLRGWFTFRKKADVMVIAKSLIGKDSSPNGKFISILIFQGEREELKDFFSIFFSFGKGYILKSNLNIIDHVLRIIF